ncbi:MAG: alkylphosphonate utilization protein, partial [Thauera sp.]|nr:alkylphosphonate utilization protein [Thauera sp.]
MSDLPHCPACGSAYTYDDGNNYVCPECGHEWSKDADPESTDCGL